MLYIVFIYARCTHSLLKIINNSLDIFVRAIYTEIYLRRAKVKVENSKLSQRKIRIRPRGGIR